jgi:tetratricopeptide (TPR) repeat protein
MLAKAEAPLRNAGHWPEWILSLAYLVTSTAMHGQPEPALAWNEQARLKAEALHHLRGIAESRLARSLIYWSTGALREAQAAEESLSQASNVRSAHLGGNLFLSDWFASARAELALNAGRPEDAIVLAEEAVRIARDAGGPFGAGMAYRIWGQALASLVPPRWDDALLRFEESIKELEAGEVWLELSRTEVARGLVLRRQGHAGGASAARACFERAASRFEASGLTEEAEQARALAIA